MSVGKREHNDDDDDAYVAKLLAEDAKRSSQRYAAVGLAALLPQRQQHTHQRRPNAVPKPNTRFLSHLVREVDSHNTALKKKEELEARIRLREIRDSGRRRDDGHHERDGGHRSKRRWTGHDDDSEDESRRRRKHDVSDRSRHRDRSPHRSHKHERTDRSLKARKHDMENKRRHHSHRHSRKQRSQSAESHNDETMGPAPRVVSDTDTSPHKRKHRSKRSVSASSSDPLEDLVLANHRSFSSKSDKVRGRGAQLVSRSNRTSNIDSHFSSTYDPSLDVHPEDEEQDERDDWDMALEALRDRTMWKKKQTERMREAGFDEVEIRNWAKQDATATAGGERTDVGNVRWAKKGEAREWDLGKKGFDDT